MSLFTKLFLTASKKNPKKPKKTQKNPKKPEKTPGFNVCCGPYFFAVKSCNSDILNAKDMIFKTMG